MKEPKNFLVGAGAAIILIILGFILFFRECAVIDSINPENNKQCRCLGKKLDIDAWLGHPMGFDSDLPHYETCIGIVTKRL